MQASVQTLDEVTGLPLLILQVDLDGVIRYVNEAFELVFGWQHSELRGLRAVTLLRPDNWRKAEPDKARLYDEVKSGRREHASFELQLYARDGHAVSVAMCIKLIRHHRLLQIEMRVLSHEPVLLDHRAQFADPMARMAFQDFVENKRQEQIKDLRKRVEGFEQALLEAMYAPDQTKSESKTDGHLCCAEFRVDQDSADQGHHPLKEKFDTREKLEAELYAAVNDSQVWQPTRRGVCEQFGCSENSLKSWLRHYGLLRHGSVARTLSEMAEELGLLGDSYLD